MWLFTPTFSLAPNTQYFSYSNFSSRLVRLTGVLPTHMPAGDLDVKFGGSGVVATKIGSGGVGSDVAIQADGKIVVAGEGLLPAKGLAVLGVFGLARYKTNGSL